MNDTESEIHAATTSTNTTVKPYTKRPVSFGNPALGVYHGFVYTYNNNSNNSNRSAVSTSRPVLEGAAETHRLVAMVDVPPEQVPEGILNLARPHQPWIDHVRIVIADNNNDDTTNTTTGPSRTYLVLLELSTEEAAQVFVEDLHCKPYTSLDETQVCYVYHVLALEGEDGVSLLSPFFAPSSETIASTTAKDTNTNVANTANTENSNTPRNNPNIRNHPAEDYHCAVCLEQIAADRRSRLTTVCNHSFHLECLLQWQDSPCPVCRYDHSGLNNNEALSECHECGTTLHNFVCLICGVVSCGGGASGGVANQQYSNTPDNSTDCQAVAAASVATAPLVAAAAKANTPEDTSSYSASTAATCDPLGSNPHSHQEQYNHPNLPPPQYSHARKHYDETLHAYALDTETQHVWDFAGQGYVHRLLQNKDDGKLVEVNDPRNTTCEERTLSPGLTQAQEGEMVHRKLETFASQYYTLLKSQLEQQRIYYEGRLEEIKHEHNNRHPPQRPADLLLALRQEKHQLSQRLGSLQSRCRKTRDDVSFLQNMNESLQANKVPLETQISQAQQERLEARKLMAELVPPLQEKVTRLMLQLESDLKPRAEG